MRTDATFITIPYSQLPGASLPFKNVTGINVLIDSTEFDISVITNYANEFHCRFVYSLSDTIIYHNQFADLLPRLYLLHTLCDGLIKDKNIIPIFSNTIRSEYPGTHLLKNYFEQQGEKYTGFAFFEQNNNSIQLTNALLFIPASQLESFGEAEFETYINQEINQIYLTGDAIEKENKWLEILFHTVALTRNNSWRLYESALWQERAKLYLSFILLGKKVGETEYHDLRQWYHNEYEVLPMWFKRLGHIIKVLVGKRNFRSLFRDDVKKHK